MIWFYNTSITESLVQFEGSAIWGQVLGDQATILIPRLKVMRVMQGRGHLPPVVRRHTQNQMCWDGSAQSTPARFRRDGRPARFGDFPAHDRRIGDLFRFNELLPLQAEESRISGLKCFGRAPGEAETAVVPNGGFQQSPLQVHGSIALDRHVGQSGPSIIVVAEIVGGLPPTLCKYIVN
jgi:hypothetical protein